MANNKQRYINTRFWNDSYVAELDPIEKLLFVYFLTNEHTNISGVYELPLKIMAVETGIDSSMFNKIMPRLEDRVRYINGYIIIKNHIKHQETESPNVRTGILNCLKELNLDFLKDLVNKGYYVVPTYYMDTLCIPYTEGRNYSNSNLDSNSITKSNATALRAKKVFKKDLPLAIEGGIVRIIKLFEDIDIKNKEYYKQTSQRNACVFLIENYGLEEVLAMIPKLKELNQTSYYQITTPFEMKKNIVKVFNDIKRKGSNIKTKGRGLA